MQMNILSFWSSSSWDIFLWLQIHVLCLLREKMITPKHWPQYINIHRQAHNYHCAWTIGWGGRCSFSLYVIQRPKEKAFYLPYLLLNRIWTHSLNVLMSSVSRMKESHFSATNDSRQCFTDNEMFLFMSLLFKWDLFHYATKDLKMNLIHLLNISLGNECNLLNGLLLTS